MKYVKIVLGAIAYVLKAMFKAIMFVMKKIEAKIDPVKPVETPAPTTPAA